MDFFNSFFETLSDLLGYSLFDDLDLGRYGEKLTEEELLKANRQGFEGKILRNLYVPKDGGGTTEIDVLYLCRKGLFVIESKNYSGWIFGNEGDQNWTASLPNGQKNHFYNPIKQNQSHIRWLKSFMSNERNIPIFSIIAFSERCSLKKIDVYSPNVYVINRDKMKSVIRSIWENEDILNEAYIESLYQKLVPLTNVDQETKREHIDNIRKSTNNNRIQNDQFNIVADMFLKSMGLGYLKNETGGKKCPRCGAPLVVRTAQKGSNAGNKFYGCSSFPRCKYTEKL